MYCAFSGSLVPITPFLSKKKYPVLGIFHLKSLIFLEVIPVEERAFRDGFEVADYFAVFADLADAVGREGVAPAAAEVAGPKEGLFSIDHLPVHVVVVSVEGGPHIWVGGEEVEVGEAVDSVPGLVVLFDVHEEKDVGQFLEGFQFGLSKVLIDAAIIARIVKAVEEQNPGIPVQSLDIPVRNW